jgi:hypothetical protein
MNNRILLGTLFFVIMANLLPAQNSTDALRYALMDYVGTARSVGAGGAMGALGADFSVLSTNPAGLGWYRRSEFIFTPSVAATTTKSVLNSTPNFSEDSRSVFNLAGFGIVIAGTPRGGDWNGVNFGIGLNRTADFNQKLLFRGDSKGSITDRFLELANSDFGLDDFESGLAADANAIYDTNNDGFYESDFELAPNALVSKQQIVTSKGSMSELVLSLAGNYKERLLIGATIGLPFVSFTEEKVYTEEDNGKGTDGDIPFFDALEFRENLTTTGLGINFKVGVVVRPIQALRLGAAIHSPTAFKLQDTYNNSLTYDYTEDGQGYTGDGTSPDGLFEYKLRTPWRYIGSAGVVIGKWGFLSGEVEYADYAKNRFRYDEYVDEEQTVNDSITNQLTDALNIRLGGELTYDIFRFRAGYGLHYSPYAGDDTVNNSLSGGFGIRGESFFLDVAYRRYMFKETYLPYLTSQAPLQFVDTEVNKDQFLLTLGFKF